jgi:uncharacterized membrane protein YdbT with pleckstrin-like domain
VNKNIKTTFKASLNALRIFLCLSFILFVAFLSKNTQTSLVICLVWLVLFVAVFYVSHGLLGKTSYIIEENKVIRQTHFWGRRYKEILLHNIKEVELHVGVLQNFFGLGTIVLHTQANLASHKGSGITLVDIDNPDALYQELKQATQEAQSREE